MYHHMIKWFFIQVTMPRQKEIWFSRHAEATRNQDGGQRIEAWVITIAFQHEFRWNKLLTVYFWKSDHYEEIWYRCMWKGTFHVESQRHIFWTKALSRENSIPDSTPRVGHWRLSGGGGCHWRATSGPLTTPEVRYLGCCRFFKLREWW